MAIHPVWVNGIFSLYYEVSFFSRGFSTMLSSFHKLVDMPGLGESFGAAKQG